MSGNDLLANVLRRLKDHANDTGTMRHFSESPNQEESRAVVAAFEQLRPAGEPAHDKQPAPEARQEK